MIVPGVVLLIALVGLSFTLANGTSPTPVSDAVEPSDSRNPFGSGPAVGLTEAEDRAPFPVARPREDPLAADDRIAAVWFQGPPAGPRVGIEYKSGVFVRVYLFAPGEPLVGDGDPGERPVVADTIDQSISGFAQFYAEALGGSQDDYLVDVNGRPAAIVPRGAGSDPSVTPSILMAASDSVFVLIAADVESEVLVRLARSVK